MDDLYFDPVKVDTSLATAYIKKKTAIEEPKPRTVWNYTTKTITTMKFQYTELSITKLNQKLRKLSKKLQDNCELFCQLEQLMRKTDVDETRNCHLKLISQYFRCEEPVNVETRKAVVILIESTPLYHLGHVATVARCNINPTLLCVKRTAPICELFYELCLDVGLEINFYCVNDNELDMIPSRFIIKQPTTMGCTLAITEDADIDSAVDVFLNSSVKAPWKIERIYVQESVYEQLMELLEVRGASERCVDVYRAAVAGVGGGVPVRAYRGSRELIALLDDDASSGVGGWLSLWCGAAPAAQELALASPSHIIWIDHYAVFDGPPTSSLPFYYGKLYDCHIPESAHTALINIQRTWLTLPLDERKAIVLELIEKASSNHPAEASNIAKLTELITDWTPSALVDIATDRITMVIDRPTSNVILFDYCNDDNINFIHDIVKILRSAILGYLCVTYIMADKKNDQRGWYCSEDLLNFFKSLISELFDAGVPVMKSDDIRNTQFNYDTELWYSNKKVIHSRFGTIYAN